MSELVRTSERWILWLVEISVICSTVMLLTVLLHRAALWFHDALYRRASRKYQPVLQRALGGDSAAMEQLAASPERYRLAIARMIIRPLVDDRDASRVAAARTVMRALSVERMANRLLNHWRWWHRTVALRALGMLQDTRWTPQLVGALDDSNAEVRNAAVDGLADMQDPAAMPALVVRLHDTSLHRGRRLAALAAFGPGAEERLIELARVHPDHRANYAFALQLCATSACRPLLCSWLDDPRHEVRAAAIGALGHAGLDEHCAGLIALALDDGDVHVRAAAAAALRQWSGSGQIAGALARHLDDEWIVAVEAGNALRSVGTYRVELERRAAESGTAGQLARQMIWELDHQR